MARFLPELRNVKSGEWRTGKRLRMVNMVGGHTGHIAESPEHMRPTESIKEE